MVEGQEILDKDIEQGVDEVFVESFILERGKQSS